jgi:arylsulfatase A-like enzyme
MGRRLLAVVCCVFAVSAAVPGGARPTPAPATRGASARPVARQRPNILVMISDDQAWSDFTPALMPGLFSRLVDHGVLFKRAYVNTSLCCPSRAQIVTGLYEHHTGVDTNTVSLERPTIVEALHDVGYRTMLAGKYLNSWPCTPRPEFDRWACVGTPTPSTYSMIDPTINEDGVWSSFDGYQTDILADQLVDFVRTTPDAQPFFAMYSPTTPHMPSDDPRYGSMTVTPPRDPAFDDDTLRDTAPLYARRPPLTANEIENADLRYTRMAHGVRSLDDAVDTILDGLGDRARDTLVIYLSDNGFLFGEHRRFGKTDAYEGSVRVPMVIRYPAVLDSAFTSHTLVSNVDIAPTLASVAGLPWEADGRSLVPVLDGSAKSVRSALLIEHCQGANEGSVPCSGLSFYAHQTRTGGFVGMETAGQKFVRYDNGDRELFDLTSDPSELHNLVGTPGSTATVASMEAKLANLLREDRGTTIVTGPWPLGSPSSRMAAFTFFSPSRFSTYRCRLTLDDAPGGWHECPGQSAVFGGLVDGHYIFEVAGIDEFGDADTTPASRSFSVTSSGPAVTIDSHPSAAQTGRNVAFSFASTVANAAFECRITAIGSPVSDWASCDPASGARYTELADGRWSFEGRDKDPQTQAWSTPPAEWLVRVDTAGPAFLLADRPADRTSSRGADFRFVPAEAIEGSISCRLDGRPTRDCSEGTFSVTGLRNGEHTLRITASDALGNIGRSNVVWTVDIGPPRIRLTRSPERFTSVPIADFRLWTKTDPSLFLCSFDGSTTMPCDDRLTLGPLPDGPHRLRVWSLDAAMNRSAPLTHRWDVDTIPPGLLLSGIPEEGAITPETTASFDVWQSEPGTPFCSLDGADFAPCVTPVVYFGLSDGPHAFEVYVVDRADNVSITASRTWTVAAVP